MSFQIPVSQRMRASPITDRGRPHALWENFAKDKAELSKIRAVQAVYP